MAPQVLLMEFRGGQCWCRLGRCEYPCRRPEGVQLAIDWLLEADDTEWNGGVCETTDGRTCRRKTLKKDKLINTQCQWTESVSTGKLHLCSSLMLEWIITQRKKTWHSNLVSAILYYRYKSNTEYVLKWILNKFRVFDFNFPCLPIQGNMNWYVHVNEICQWIIES